MKAGNAQQDVEMLDISGAGTQDVQCDRIGSCALARINTKTASRNASATGQTQQAAMQALQGKHSHSKQQGKRCKQGKRPSNRNLLPLCPPCSYSITAHLEAP